jgi:ATP/maltotriose-dependent transcriptional regulator MalT/DNA-binding SARP family transcriptional activator
VPATEVRLAKLSRPRSGGAIARERLFAGLDRLRERPVVWVAAQPGAGKTTLLASYLEARRVPCLWYQVDAGDRDCASFFYHLGVAAGALKSGKRAAAPLPLLTAECLADLAGFSRRFFRDLYARMGRGSVLVLDNLHEIDADTATHRVLATAIEEIPEGVGVLVASREEPPDAYLPLVARERIACLDPHEIRLTIEETGEIVEARADLDSASIRALHERSEGWAAGLTLLIERARKADGIDRSGGGEAMHTLFEQFAGPLVAAEVGGHLESLFALSVLPRIRPAVARALTQDEAVDSLLARMHRRNLFTVRKGAGADLSYEFHHLLRMHLQQKARAAWPAERWRDVVARAASLLEQDGSPVAAIELHRGIEDWPSMARVTLQIAPKLVAQERRLTLIDFVAALPEDERSRHPWLRYWHGAAMVPLDPGGARAILERAHADFVRLGDDIGRLLSASGVVYTHYLQIADLKALDPWIPELAGLVERGVEAPTPALEMHVLSTLLFATAFRRPDRARVDPTARRVLELVDADMGANEKIAGAAILLVFYYHTAQIETAQGLVAKVQSLLESQRIAPAIHALWSMQVGFFSHVRGELTASVEAFEASRRIAAENGLAIPLLEVYCNIGLAMCAILRGDLARAEAYRLATQPYWNSFRRMDVVSHVWLKTILASHRGDWVAAQESGRLHFEKAIELGVSWQMYYSHIQLAYMLVRAGDTAEAARLTAGARELVRDTVHDRLAYQADFVDAYRCLREGDREGLRRWLAAGLPASRADPAKFLPRLLVDFLPRIYAAALAEGIEVETARRDIRALHLAPPEPHIEGWPWPFEVCTLGRFEVLRDGRPLEFSRKAPRKTLALLKAIIAGGGRSVPEATLLEALWADEEGDAASKSLGAAVLRLRALLGDSDAVIQQGGTLSLDRSRVWVDAWAFEDFARLDLYKGTFLPEEEGVPWPVPMRERLRTKFIQRLAEHGAKLEAQERFQEAIEHYLRGLDADSIVEPFYQGLMRCYQRLDRRAEAISTYRRLKQILSVTLGLPPSATTERLYQSLRLDAEPAGNR